MKFPPLTVLAAQEWLQGLHRAPAEKWATAEFQIEVLRTFNHFSRITTEFWKKEVRERFIESSGLPAARVEALFRLTRIEEIHAAIEWPGPLPLDRSEDGAHLYPTEGWLSEYLHYTQGSEIPMAWHFWFGVALIGAALRRNMIAKVGTFEVRPPWYLLIVEETASAKSTAFGIAKAMLKKAAKIVEDSGELEKSVYVAAQSATLEAFLEKVKSEAYFIPNSDGTNRTGMTEACAVLAIDELVTLLGKKTHNPGSWINFLTAVFEMKEETYRDDKVLAGSRILHKPAISFWGGSTMSWLKSSITDEMFDGGFLGRFVFIKRRGDQKEIAWPHPLDPIWEESLALYLSKLMRMDFAEFQFTPEAKDWITQWYSRNKLVVKRWEGDKFQAYYKRKQSHLIRLTMCMCVAEARLVAEASDCERAAEILSFEEAPMSYIFSDLGAHPDKIICDYLLRFLDRARGEWVGESEMVRQTRHKAGNAENVKKFLRTLVASGEVEVGRGARGALRYRVTRALPTPEPDVLEVAEALKADEKGGDPPTDI